MVQNVPCPPAMQLGGDTRRVFPPTQVLSLLFPFFSDVLRILHLSKHFPLSPCSLTPSSFSMSPTSMTTIIYDFPMSVISPQLPLALPKGHPLPFLYIP